MDFYLKNFVTLRNMRKFALSQFKPLFMDKAQQLLTHFRMLRAATLMRLRGLQEIENVNQEEVDGLLDQLNELQERIKILEAHLKNEGK